jgi:hypothetical protein
MPSNTTPSNALLASEKIFRIRKASCLARGREPIAVRRVRAS